MLLGMNKKNNEIPEEIRSFAGNDHRVSFLINPTDMEMYVDYGKDVTEEELKEAAAQITANILDHIEDGRRTEAAEDIIHEIQEYIAEERKRS